MDYNPLLDLATNLGYELAMSGAETFRIEDSINRIMATYGIQAEVFAIPNCLIVSIETPDGECLTRMRRIGYHGNDLDGVECFNGLSRAICNRKPDPVEGLRWLDYVKSIKRSYTLPMSLFGHFLGSSGFCLFFGGSLLDAFFAGICGILVGLISKIMDIYKVNPFFSTISSAFGMGFTAYGLACIGVIANVDAVIIGTLMILVPGLLFTNAMRDIIYGDTNSGVNRIVQVLLIAMAIALGTAAAWSISHSLFGTYDLAPTISYNWLIQCFVTLFSCVGFAILFNVHSLGIWLCAIGGMLVWAVYLLAIRLGAGIIAANFLAAAFASAYSEIMARIRKYPAISYLVVSLFPLLPGAGIYYTVSYTLARNMDLSLHKGLETASIAGVLAVGVLLISSLVRVIVQNRKPK